MAKTESIITGVGVLDKGVAILDAVEFHPMGASDLARAVGLTVSTTHRLTGALMAHGLLRRDEEGRYHLGRRFTAAALSELARPALEDLRDDTGESAQLWVRRGDHRLCVASIDSREELRAALPVGALLPLQAGGSAAGVLLGERSDDDGWIESAGARAHGLGSVSAPVRLYGETVAAVCLSAPLQRVEPSPGMLHGAKVAATARRIEITAEG